MAMVSGAGRWAAAAVAFGAALLVVAAFPQLREPWFWKMHAQPGPLSPAHAFIGAQCSACHEPLKGIAAANCIGCHARESALLSRQPTAFHASIQECATCHREHEGLLALTGGMDHTAFARVAGSGAGTAARANPHLNAQESRLDCVACHETRDRHRGLFGADCAACHATTQWTLPEFRHPFASSRECAQCHQPPPSHYMMHFSMVSQRIAGKPHAQVRECYECHRTTAWNDIPGRGFYKHH